MTIKFKSRYEAEMPYCQTNGINLYYEISGKGSPLCLLAGLGDQIGNWQGVIRRLSAHFQVIAIDNRGAGLSDSPDEPYSIEMMAADTTELLEKLAISSCHLLGFSMGGYIAQHIAINRPSQINKLILVATRPGFGMPFPISKEVSEVMGDRSNTEDSLTRRFNSLFGRRYKEKVSAESFIRFKRQDNRSRSPNGYWHQLEAVSTFNNMEHVHKIRQPCLILVGLDDQLSSPENARWLHQHIPHSQLIEFPDIGHVIPVEAPTEFVTAVTGFLRKD